MINSPGQWLNFFWDLGAELAAPATPPKSYRVERIGADEYSILGQVIEKSLSLDPSWNSAMHEIGAWVERTTEKAAANEGSIPFALRHGTRIIGGTILDSTAGEQIVIGPCVLVEYRNRGLGTLLLAAALKELRGNGVTRASTIIRKDSLAARFLYPKFGGKSVPTEPLVAA